MLPRVAWSADVLPARLGVSQVDSRFALDAGGRARQSQHRQQADEAQEENGQAQQESSIRKSARCVQQLLPDLTPEAAVLLDLGISLGEEENLAALVMLTTGLKYIWEYRLANKSISTFKMMADCRHGGYSDYHVVVKT